MASIRLSNVVSFSSQDVKNPAKNLLLGDPSKPWLCSGDDMKKGKCEVTLQLPQMTTISHVDIGNCGSFSVEVQVSRCSSNEYETLIAGTNLMGPKDARLKINRTSVRMFNLDEFDSKTRTGSWERVRFICTQPFRRDMPFGLSMITICTDDTQLDRSRRDISLSPSVSQSDPQRIADIQRHFGLSDSSPKLVSSDKWFGDSLQSRLEKISQTGQASQSNSRNMRMVIAAVKTPTHRTPLVKSLQERNNLPYQPKPTFMDSVRKFYAELPVASIDPYTAKVSELRHQLEKIKCRKLSKEERTLFKEYTKEYFASRLEIDPINNNHITKEGRKAVSKSKGLTEYEQSLADQLNDILHDSAHTPSGRSVSSQRTPISQTKDTPISQASYSPTSPTSNAPITPSARPVAVCGDPETPKRERYYYNGQRAPSFRENTQGKSTPNNAQFIGELNYHGLGFTAYTPSPCGLANASTPEQKLSSPISQPVCKTSPAPAVKQHLPGKVGTSPGLAAKLAPAFKKRPSISPITAEPNHGAVNKGDRTLTANRTLYSQRSGAGLSKDPPRNLKSGRANSPRSSGGGPPSNRGRRSTAMAESQDRCPRTEVRPPCKRDCSELISDDDDELMMPVKRQTMSSNLSLCDLISSDEDEACPAKVTSETHADMRKSVAAGGGIRVSPGAGSYIDLLSDHEEPQLISSHQLPGRHSNLTEQVSNLLMIQCPICMKSYPSDEIEVHASDCVID